MKRGLPVYSPIVYWHPISKLGGLPTDAAFWMKENMGKLRMSEVMFVLCLEGWKQSAGMNVEIRVAQTLGIPLVHFDTDFKEIPDAIVETLYNKERGSVEVSGLHKH
jgi:hypothetical protein